MRFRVPQLSHTKIAVSGFFRVLTPSKSNTNLFLRVGYTLLMTIEGTALHIGGCYAFFLKVRQ
jgi:hypothetical protein